MNPKNITSVLLFANQDGTVLSYNIQLDSIQSFVLFSIFVYLFSLRPAQCQILQLFIPECDLFGWNPGGHDIRISIRIGGQMQN